MRVSQIWVYPIKSCAGIRVESALLGERGLAFDRHWMVVDGAGQAVTMRESPRLIRIRPRLAQDHLEVSAPEMPPLRIAYEAPGEELSVRLFGKAMAGTAVAEAEAWFSAYLGLRARLVYVAKTNTRTVNAEFGTQRISFVDGNPVNLVSAASLADLNTRLADPVAPGCFRANLLISGARPYAEDGWREISIGEVSFEVYESCQRCMVVNIDPENGVYAKEPLATLAKYRRHGKHVLFGRNLSYRQGGVLSVGDKLEVLTGV